MKNITDFILSYKYVTLVQRNLKYKIGQLVEDGEDSYVDCVRTGCKSNKPQHVGIGVFVEDELDLTERIIWIRGQQYIFHK